MNPRDFQDLARLHVLSLEDSLVTELGDRYARSFYRYIASSDQEILLVRRNPDGAIGAAAVVSLNPETLNRRLLLATPLLWNALLRFPRLARRIVQSSVGPRSESRTIGLPELILIFTSPDARGKGIGADLIREAEEKLKARGIRKYRVKTVSDPANRALRFYESLGFTPDGLAFQQGRTFQVFSKPVSP